MSHWLIPALLLYVTFTGLFVLGCCRVSGDADERMGIKNEGEPATLPALPPIGRPNPAAELSSPATP